MSLKSIKDYILHGDGLDHHNSYGIGRRNHIKSISQDPETLERLHKILSAPESQIPGKYSVIPDHEIRKANFLNSLGTADPGRPTNLSKAQKIKGVVNRVVKLTAPNITPKASSLYNTYQKIKSAKKPTTEEVSRKKLKQILEGEVISLSAFRKPKPENLMTKDQVRDKVDQITSAKSKLFSHPSLSPEGSMDHSITHIAHHIGHNPNTFYPDSTSDGFKDFVKRKSIATQHYHNNKEAIDTHVSDTIRSLESLENSVSRNKFVDEKSRLSAQKEVFLAKNHWKNVQSQLSKVEK